MSHTTLPSAVDQSAARLTRRQFGCAVAGVTTGAIAVPSIVRGRNLNEKLNIAMIGVGGRGAANLGGVAAENIVALCDVYEPAVDHALPGQGLPLLRHVVVVGQDIPHTGRSLDDFLALGGGVSDPELDALARKVRPSDLLLIQFTSGTTAYPKAVMLTHDNILRNAWAVGLRLGIRPEDRYFNCRPFFHVAGTTLSLLVSLVAGACLVTLPTFEAGAALRMMTDERCTLTSGNDTLFQMMLGHPSFDRTALSARMASSRSRERFQASPSPISHLALTRVSSRMCSPAPGPSG